MPRSQHLLILYGGLIAMLLCCVSAVEPSGSSGGARSGSGAGGTSGGGAGGSSAGGGGSAPADGNITHIDGGRYHTCISMKSGAVYCWGQGAYGALGNDGSY